MQYTVAFSVWNILHYTRVSGSLTSLNLDRRDLYSNHISQSKSQSYGDGRGRGGSYAVVNVEAVHRTCTHAVPRGEGGETPRISKNSCVSVAGTRSETVTRSRTT